MNERDNPENNDRRRRLVLVGLVVIGIIATLLIGFLIIDQDPAPEPSPTPTPEPEYSAQLDITEDNPAENRPSTVTVSAASMTNYQRLVVTVDNRQRTLDEAGSVRFESMLDGQQVVVEGVKQDGSKEQIETYTVQKTSVDFLLDKDANPEYTRHYTEWSSTEWNNNDWSELGSIGTDNTTVIRVVGGEWNIDSRSYVSVQPSNTPQDIELIGVDNPTITAEEPLTVLSNSVYMTGFTVNDPEVELGPSITLLGSTTTVKNNEFNTQVKVTGDAKITNNSFGLSENIKTQPNAEELNHSAGIDLLKHEHGDLYVAYNDFTGVDKDAVFTEEGVTYRISTSAITKFTKTQSVTTIQLNNFTSVEDGILVNMHPEAPDGSDAEAHIIHNNFQTYEDDFVIDDKVPSVDIFGNFFEDGSADFWEQSDYSAHDTDSSDSPNENAGRQP